jgi:hypothetical protein
MPDRKVGSEAHFAAFPVGHFVMLFSIPHCFCKWLFFSIFPAFGGEKARVGYLVDSGNPDML